MSIAVMNWVWANSPTSGNERLVLLALADACSRDDGTGCWPSAATIARKANVSDRTVRRVITRLEAEGHLIVHRGGGRTGSTNSYTVVTGNRVIHSPGLNDTPDSLSGGDTGDRSPLTELCQGTHDTTVSPDPPDNHQGTAAASAPDARPAVAATTGADVVEFFAALGDAWRLTETQRARLTAAVQAALDMGWAPQALASVTGANTTGVRNPYAVLAARLSSAELPALSVRSARTPWCGECDQVTRMLDYHGDAPRRCPNCKGPRPRQPNGWRPRSGVNDKTGVGSLQDRQAFEGKDLRPCQIEYRLLTVSAATSTS
ncbi:MAG TPA: helix-turn-helix domain-containing protein, partial [Streptosporangiaceae bacterium]|nr:helix-turn-helix domain-containing protein [Streptosporangiaceae bacterium]